MTARESGAYDRAAELAGRIPIEAVADTVRMQNLLAQRKWKDLIEQFGNADLARWPFWKAGEAHFARGRAYLNANTGDKAEADLQAALEFTSDSRTRTSILLNIGINRETVLKNDSAALEIYRRIAGQKRNTGSADYFRGVQSAARILTRRGKFDDALETLKIVDVTKLRGHWRGSMLLARGETLSAAGRKDPALAVYRAVLSDEFVEPVHRKIASERIGKLHGK